jgi:hypothetical protein
MMVAYGRGQPIVDAKSMWLAMLDTDFVRRHFFWRSFLIVAQLIAVAALSFVIIKYSI